MAVISDISVSLDGYVAGPNQTLEQPLGEGGEGLHEWVFGLKSWREPHGLEGGEAGLDDDVMSEAIDRKGATIMGRRMFSSGEGPWENDPKANGWWGDEPPFRHPVFVLTHHAREPLELQGTTFTFVTDGIEAALEQARAAAEDKDVQVAAARMSSSSTWTPASSTSSSFTSSRCCSAAECACSTGSTESASSRRGSSTRPP